MTVDREASRYSRRAFLSAAGLSGLAWLALPRAASAVPAGGPAAKTAASFGGAARSGDAPADLLVRGGTVVTEGGRADADVRVRDGKIVEVAGDLRPEAGERVLDAEGLYVLPGGIDPHVHLTTSPSTPEKYRPADDLTAGSRAALAGGITSLGNMTVPGRDEGLLNAVKRDTANVAEKALADVMLHPVVLDPAEALEALPTLLEAGHTSLKVFMVLPQFDQNVEAYLTLMEKAGAAGVLTLIHCEDRAIIDRATQGLVAAGRTSYRDYAATRPVSSEVVAVERAMGYAEASGAPVYIVHLSSQRALDACRRGRARGLAAFVETRPLYLHLTDEVYQRADAALYIGQPPVRGQADQDALWAGLAAGEVNTLGTDHVGWSREQKMNPALDITDLRPGVNNLQVMRPMLFSEGVVSGRLSLERFVAVTSTNAARLFGLYPQKGTIAVGADADLVLWDASETREIRGEDLLSNAGYSIYEGRQVTGWPRTTVLRGRVVYDEAKIQSEPGSGQLLKRGPTGRI